MHTTSHVILIWSVADEFLSTMTVKFEGRLSFKQIVTQSTVDLVAGVLNEVVTDYSLVFMSSLL